MPAHIHGKMSPESPIPPFMPMIMFYSSPSLLVISIFDVQNTEIFFGRVLRPSICTRFALMTMATNFKGQMSTKVCTLLVLLIIVCYNSLYLLMIVIFFFKSIEISL